MSAGNHLIYAEAESSVGVMIQLRHAVLLVALCFLAPAIVLELLYILPPALKEQARDHQALIGGTIAAVAAVVGYFNITRQIEAGRLHEEARRRFERQQILSALIGEISGLVSLVKEREISSYYAQNAAWIRELIGAQGGTSPDASNGSEAERKSETPHLWAIALSSDYMPIYSRLGADIGKVPRGLPEKIVAVYTEFYRLFDRLAAAETGTYDGLPPESIAGMADLIVGETNRAVVNAEHLVAELRQRLG